MACNQTSQWSIAATTCPRPRIWLWKIGGSTWPYLTLLMQQCQPIQLWKSSFRAKSDLCPCHLPFLCMYCNAPNVMMLESNSYSDLYPEFLFWTRWSADCSTYRTWHSVGYSLMVHLCRYAGLLEAAMSRHVPKVGPIESEELLDFCADSGYNCRLEPSGTLLMPPEYNVGMTDWERSLRLRLASASLLYYHFWRHYLLPQRCKYQGSANS